MEQFLNSDFLGFISGRSLLIIMHLFGLAIGAGAAFFSDFLFTHILKDRRIDENEFGVLKLVSNVVWIGLTVLVFSGLLLFLGNPAGYLGSSKFLAKMTVIGILIINGMVFGIKHIPLLERFLNKDLRELESQNPKLRFFFVSGAVSGVSWASAIILGALRSIPYSYSAIIGIYVTLLLTASIAGILLHRYYFMSDTKEQGSRSNHQAEIHKIK